MSRRSTLLGLTHRLIGMRRATREQARSRAGLRIPGTRNCGRYGVMVHCAHQNQDHPQGRPAGAQGNEEGTSKARVKIQRAEGMAARHGCGAAICAAESAHSEANEALTCALSAQNEQQGFRWRAA